MAEFPTSGGEFLSSGLQNISIGLLLLLCCACNSNPYEDPGRQGVESHPPATETSLETPSGETPAKSKTSLPADSKDSVAEHVNTTEGPPIVKRAVQAKPTALQPGRDVSAQRAPRLNSKESLSKTDFVIQGAFRRPVEPARTTPVKKPLSPEAQSKIDAHQRQLEAMKRAGLNSKAKIEK